MTGEMHPQVVETLQLGQRLMSALNGQLHQLDTESFTGTDESETVTVNLDGHHWLTSLWVEDGLLRLGAETVQQRLNQALHNAHTAATEASEAARERLYGELAEIAEELGSR